MSISSLIDSGTGKIYDNLIPQGGGVALTKGQLISANDQNPPVEVAVPVGVNGTILMADSTQVDGLRWAVVPGAVALAQGQLLSGNLAGDPTIVVAPVLPAQAGWVLSADGTAGAAGTNMAWKPPTGAGGLLTANLPLFDDATTTPNTIGINFTAVKGEIPAGTGGAKIGALIPPPAHDGYVLKADAAEATGLIWAAASETLTASLPLLLEEPQAGDPTISIAFTAVKGEIPAGTGASSVGSLVPAPTVNNYVLTSASAEATGLKWAPLAGPSGSITTIAPLQDLENPPGSGVNELSIAYTAKGDLPVGTAAKTGVILPIGATDGQVLEVYGGAPSGMRWATPAPPSGGPTINRSNAATVEIAQPQSLNETMILVAEEPNASWDAVESQGGDTAPYELEFTTPWFKNFQNPAAQDSGLQGVVEYINGARTIRLDIINQGSGSVLTLGHLIFEEYNSPARVYGYIGPEGASSLMGNSIIIVGAFTKLIYTGPTPAPPLLCSQILGVDFQNTQNINAFNLPSPNVGTALGLSGFGPQGYCSSIQFLPGTSEYVIGGKFSNILCSPSVPGSGGYMSLCTYNTTTNEYDLSPGALGAGLGVRLSGGPGTVNDMYWNAATFQLVVVGEFDELVVDANTNIPAPANSHGLAKWTLPLAVSPWSNTPTGTPTPVPDGICCRPMVSQGAGILVICGSSGIPVAYNITTNSSTTLTGTYPSPAIPFSFNCAVGGTTDIGAGQVAYDFILYNDTTNLVCYVYWYSAANGTVATALAPAPTGFIPDDTGGVILNGGIYLFIDYDALPVVNLLQVAAKGSIYRYSGDTHATIDFTLGTGATPFIGFIENGQLWHTVSFNGPTCPQSQSYISNSGKTAWIQIGAKTTGITYS